MTASYKYDADGIRTQKTVNGVTTDYVLEGDTVVKETNGTDTLWYYYDAAGSLVSFELNGTAYFYVKNMQGDIVAITNASGNKVVEYTYDSWGKLISTSGSLASTVGVKNPYRYRSYRYDTETGLYYLQSRYYDPEMMRFVNADGYASTGQGVLGNNMFVYCGNNPIIRVDVSGDWWNVAIGAVVGAGFGLISAFVNKESLSETIVTVLCGAASGALSAMGIGGLGGQMAIGAITSAIDSGYQNYNDYTEGEKTFKQAVTETLVDTTVGAAFGAMGYDGTDAYKTSSKIAKSTSSAKKTLSQKGVHPKVKAAAKAVKSQGVKYIGKETLSSLFDNALTTTVSLCISKVTEICSRSRI